MNNNIEKYSDIINLPHHVSKKHPQMSIEARAAQFAPFAALTGYGDAVKETARLTSERIEINDEVKEILNNKLRIIQKEINNSPKVTVTYFIPDLKKKGGKYVTITGNVKRIDQYKHIIILQDYTEILITEIIGIDIE